jgi:hypothetical protein
MLLGAFRGGNPLERIVGVARKCQLVSTPEITGFWEVRGTPVDVSASWVRNPTSQLEIVWDLLFAPQADQMALPS